MRYIALLLIVCLCGVGAVYSQDGAPTKKGQAFVMPPEIILPVIAVQPDCPLKFENVKVLYDLDWGMANSFELRNRGTKPIRDYTIVWYTSYGDGSIGHRSREDLDNIVLPGALVSRSGQKFEVEIVPLTDEMRRKFKLDKWQYGIAVYMVARVEYADGTVYNNEAAAKALEAYCDRLSKLYEP